MNKNDLEKRTKVFALRVVKFVNQLPAGRASDVLGRQLLKSGTSVGANYREANRAESYDDFIHKIALCEKEASESQYWLELLNEADIKGLVMDSWLLQEATELLAIFTSIGKTARSRRNDSSTNFKRSS